MRSNVQKFKLSKLKIFNINNGDFDAIFDNKINMQSRGFVSTFVKQRSF